MDTKRRKEAEEQAKKLVEQMTLEEKVSQIVHQAKAVERLGIPNYNWWGEALHGVARAGTATVFPQAIGLAAAFDPEMMQEVATCVSDEARAKYNAQQKYQDYDIYKGLTLWAPNVNIFRDPRWGRGQETYGEDPYLAGLLGTAYIKGLQGDDENYLKTAACAKHYAVHSGPEDLRHKFNAVTSKQDLFETYLPAFKACVIDGQVEAVMGAYNRVNGDAACAHPYLIEDVLRGKWHFEGHFVSDCWAIADLFKDHALFDNPTDAVAETIARGCDLNCGTCYSHAYDAVLEGKLDEHDLNRAVTRLLSTRILLGILGEKNNDSKPDPYESVPYEINDSPEHKKLNREVAAKTIVLLKNNGILPLNIDAYQNIGLIGPNADSKKALCGNYEGTASEYVTVANALSDFCKEENKRLFYSLGCHLYKNKTSGLAYENDRVSEVKAVCEASDLIIAVFGLDATLEGEEGDTGNEYGSGDKPNLNFPGIQRTILDTIYQSEKPVILLNLSGSPLYFDEDQKSAAAILQCWYPGAEGGNAILDILTGKVSPQAKLPLTFYNRKYEIPDFCDYSMKNRTYRFIEDQEDVLYPFGYGLTYADIQLTNAELIKVNKEETSVSIRVSVENKDSRSARETIQVYVEEKANGRIRAQLKKLLKCPLEAKEKKSFDIRLDREAFVLFNGEGEEYISEKTYRIYCGFSQADKRSVSLCKKEPVVLEVKF